MMQPFILMEQYRSSLTPRTQRRSQNICSDTAKIQTLFETTKDFHIYFQMYQGDRYLTY
jgi:hypothetical protein